MMRLKQILIACDQLINTLTGSGWADETLSAYYWRTCHRLRKWVDRLFFWEKDHCLGSYKAEIERRQLPPGYRNLTNTKGD
jgi:hypothetical protein